MAKRFVGRHDHTLDDKGRLILPRVFRPRLEEGAYLTGIGECLGLFPEEEFYEMSDRLEEQIERGEVTPDAVRMFAADADMVVPDSQGRIRLLPHLLEEAGLEPSSPVVVNGALRRIEIWSPERFAGMRPVGRGDLASAVGQGYGIAPRSRPTA